MNRSLLLLMLLVASPINAADWPTWRGVDRDGVSRESGLLKSWPVDGPKKVWTTTDAGLGYSSFSVVGDRLYTLGAIDDAEYLLSFDVNDGRLVWKTPIGNKLDNGWGGGPRSTPTVAGELVVALGGEGGLHCVAVSDGAEKWSVEMQDLGGKVPNWGYSESPLVDGDRVLCTPGGRNGAVAAFNLKTGEKIWQSSDVTEGAHYSSIIAVNHHGQHQYIQLTEKKVFGLDKDGSFLWDHEWPGKVAVVPTPIYHEGDVYVTSGYDAGCMLLRIDDKNGVEQLYSNKTMKNHHGGVIRVGDHVYGYSDNVGWLCQDLLSGELVWNEKSKLGKGAIAFADDMLYCIDEQSGKCVLVEATTEGWTEKGRFRLEPQTEQRSPKGKVWTHPVIANGRLYLRDQEIICCYDIRG